MESLASQNHIVALQGRRDALERFKLDALLIPLANLCVFLDDHVPLRSIREFSTGTRSAGLTAGCWWMV